MVEYQTQGQEAQTAEFDAILVATGRSPNVEGLNCEAAGIQYDQRGIKVDKHLQTTNKLVYAVGDCISGPKFTHNSDI